VSIYCGTSADSHSSGKQQIYNIDKILVYGGDIEGGQVVE